MVKGDCFTSAADITEDGSWRPWSEEAFPLLLWLVETTACATCIFPRNADPALQLKIQGLLDAIDSHQEIRDTRRRLGRGLCTDARLVCSRENVADRLEAMRRSGLLIRFRPSAELSAIEMSVLPMKR